jgi:excisionase family DNA binding protein
VTESWEQRISRWITPSGAVIVPPRVAAWLEDKSGLTADRRITLRSTDPQAYEVLMALHLAALSSETGTKDSAGQHNQPNSEPWLTTIEAAELAGVSDRCVRKRIATGRLPATLVGHRWLIRPTDIHTQALTA